MNNHKRLQSSTVSKSILGWDSGTVGMNLLFNQSLIYKLPSEECNPALF